MNIMTLEHGIAVTQEQLRQLARRFEAIAVSAPDLPSDAGGSDARAQAAPDSFGAHTETTGEEASSWLSLARRLRSVPAMDTAREALSALPSAANARLADIGPNRGGTAGKAAYSSTDDASAVAPHTRAGDDHAQYDPISSQSSAHSSDLVPTLREALQDVAVLLDGESVGRLVAPTVNREIGRMARARRYTG